MMMVAVDVEQADCTVSTDRAPLCRRLHRIRLYRSDHLRHPGECHLSLKIFKLRRRKAIHGAVAPRRHSLRPGIDGEHRCPVPDTRTGSEVARGLTTVRAEFYNGLICWNTSSIVVQQLANTSRDQSVKAGEFFEIQH